MTHAQNIYYECSKLAHIQLSLRGRQDQSEVDLDLNKVYTSNSGFGCKVMKTEQVCHTFVMSSQSASHHCLKPVLCQYEELELLQASGRGAMSFLLAMLTKVSCQ